MIKYSISSLSQGFRIELHGRSLDWRFSLSVEARLDGPGHYVVSALYKV